MEADPVAIARELIRFRTINPPGEEEVAARHCGALLEAAGRSLLELMAASEADLTRKLESYRHSRTPPKVFDPKNYRRALGKPLPGLDSRQWDRLATAQRIGAWIDERRRGIHAVALA
jgi:hypothetical protein